MGTAFSKRQSKIHCGSLKHEEMSLEIFYTLVSLFSLPRVFLHWFLFLFFPSKA